MICALCGAEVIEAILSGHNSHEVLLLSNALQVFGHLGETQLNNREVWTVRCILGGLVRHQFVCRRNTDGQIPATVGKGEANGAQEISEARQEPETA